MFLIYWSYLTALSHANNIACSGCKENRSKIALTILMKVENRQIDFYPWYYTIIFFIVFLNLFSTNFSDRGGVGDIRLEAKETKKIRGQS